MSSNNGINWTQTSFRNLNVFSMTAYSNYVFAGTGDSGVFISADYGNNWFKSSLNNEYIRAITLISSNIFAGLHRHYSYNTSGMYQSANNGNTWFRINEGFGVNPDIYSLLIANDYIFAGPSQNYVWRRPISELVGIEYVNSSVPKEFSLSQNYPNPYNPTTTIRFAIPSNVKREMSNVKIIIYDALGREIQTIVNEQLSPGTYEVEWNAAVYSSGVYFYTIKAGKFTQTLKMVLIK
jgi:hypothetical protein